MAMDTSSRLDQLGAAEEFEVPGNRHDREFVMVITRLKP